MLPLRAAIRQTLGTREPEVPGLNIQKGERESTPLTAQMLKFEYNPYKVGALIHGGCLYELGKLYNVMCKKIDD